MGRGCSSAWFGRRYETRKASAASPLVIGEREKDNHYLFCGADVDGPCLDCLDDDGWAMDFEGWLALGFWWWPGGLWLASHAEHKRSPLSREPPMQSHVRSLTMAERGGRWWCRWLVHERKSHGVAVPATPIVSESRGGYVRRIWYLPPPKKNLLRLYGMVLWQQQSNQPISRFIS